MHAGGAEARTGPQSLFAQLALSGYKVVPDPAGNDRKAGYIGGHNLKTYGSHRANGVDAIQLEFGSQLRARES